MSAQNCPECGTPRRADASPDCACGPRAAAAAADVRSAEAAAAEDFDPLRIRPYVSIPDSPEEPPRPDDLSRFAGTPSTPTPSRPVPYGTHTPDPEPTAPYPDDRRARRRRAPLIAMAVAAGGVVAAAVAVASGVFTPGPDAERALPDRATSAPATDPGPHGSPSPSSSASASAKPSPSPSPSRSTSPSAATSVAASPTPAPPTAAATGSVSTTGIEEREPPVLREGDGGAEVLELQERLRQIYFYNGPSHGEYDAFVTDAVTRFQYAEQIVDDPQGVYGAATRRALESQTDEP